MKEIKSPEQAKKEFLSLAIGIKRDGIKKIIKWLLSTDFFEAPASTRFHGNFPGGLAQHSVNVCNRLRRLYTAEKQTEGKELTPEEEETLLVVALFHDLCKVDFYKKAPKNKKVYSQTGRKDDHDGFGPYDWKTVDGYIVDDSLPYGHGEKSVYMLQSFGFKLSREEAFAIRYHMGDFADYNTSKAYNLFPLAMLLHSADLMASYLDEPTLD